MLFGELRNSIIGNFMSIIRPGIVQKNIGDYTTKATVLLHSYTMHCRLVGENPCS